MKYRPSTSWIVTLLILGGMSVGITLYSISVSTLYTSSFRYIIFDFFLIFSFILLISYPAFGMFLTFDGKKLCRVDFFFIKKSFLIDQITDLKYTPTFITGPTYRTLNIVQNMEGNYRETSMSYPVFSEKTIVNLINDLKKSNSNIRLDPYAEALIKKYSDY